MYTVFDKIYLARLLLSLKFKDAASQSGITQMAVSQIERGERKNMPIEYLKYLYKKGVDLNWLLNDESNDLNKCFRDNEYSSETDLKCLIQQMKDLNFKVDILANSLAAQGLLIKQHG